MIDALEDFVPLDVHFGLDGDDDARKLCLPGLRPLVIDALVRIGHQGDEKVQHDDKHRQREQHVQHPQQPSVGAFIVDLTVRACVRVCDKDTTRQDNQRSTNEQRTDRQNVPSKYVSGLTESATTADIGASYPRTSTLI